MDLSYNNKETVYEVWFYLEIEIDCRLLNKNTLTLKMFFQFGNERHTHLDFDYHSYR